MGAIDDVIACHCWDRDLQNLTISTTGTPLRLSLLPLSFVPHPMRTLKRRASLMKSSKNSFPCFVRHPILDHTSNRLTIVNAGDIGFIQKISCHGPPSKNCPSKGTPSSISHKMSFVRKVQSDHTGGVERRAATQETAMRLRWISRSVFDEE